jgi:hypothetical protein
MGGRIPAGYVGVAFLHRFDGRFDEAICTMGFEKPDGFSHSAATALSDTWKANVVPWLTANVQYVGLRVSEAAGTLDEVSESQHGAAGSAAAPPNICGLVKKVTGVPGKKNRGRMYLPGIPKAELNELGFLSSAQLSGLQSSLNDWMGDLITADWVPVVLHALAGVSPTTITSLQLQQQCATQRGRLRD